MAEVDLTGVFAKLGRAKTYATELKERVDAWCKDDPHFFTFEFNSQAGQYASIIHDLGVVDPEWTLIVGEIVFHLRSCLDHLAWQMVIFDEQSPGENTQYPIRESPYSKKGTFVPTQLNPRLRSSALLDALERTQPYRAMATEVVNDVPVLGGIDLQNSLTHPLNAIRRLNNIDKHRLLLVTAAVLDMGEMWWGLPSDFPPPRYILNPGVLKSGEPVAWFDFGGREAPDNFDPHPAIRVSLREPEVAFLTTVAVSDYMLHLCRFWLKEWVLEWKFCRVFAGEPILT